MHYLTLGVFSLTYLISLSSWAQDDANEALNLVDFSQTFVVQDPAIPTGDVKLGGVQTHVDGLNFTYALTLSLDTVRILEVDAPVEEAFFIKAVTPQDNDAESLQQRLTGTVWRGEYRTNKNLYATTLTIESVQKGFVGAEIVHNTTDPEQDSLLHAKLLGEISTEYLIDENGDGELEWVANVRYQMLVDEVNAANAELEEDAEPALPPAIQGNRQLLKLERGRGIEFRHASSNWGSHKTYDMVVEDNRITGGVGTPPDRYSTTDTGMTANGTIELTPDVPVVVDTE